MSISGNMLWSLAGNLAYAASQWLVVLLIARLSSTDDVGEYSFALAVNAPLFLLGNLQLRAVQATDAKDRFDFTDYWSLRTWSTLMVFVGVCGVMFFLDRPRSTKLVVLAVAVAKSAESFSDICYGSFQHRQRMDFVARSLLLRAGLSLIALTGGLVVQGLLLGVTLSTLTWILTMIAHDTRLVKLTAGSWRGWWALSYGEGVRRLFIVSLPLGIVMMLISLNVNVPRYYVEAHGGRTALGVFTVVSYLALAGNTFILAVGQAITPSLAERFAAAQYGAFWRALALFHVAGALLAVGGVGLAHFCGSYVLNFLYGPQYAGQGELFRLVAFAIGVGYVASCAGYGMTAAGCFRSQIPLFVIVTIVTVVGCARWIPNQGPAGACYAMLVASTTQLGGSALITGLATLRRESGML